MAVDSLSGSAGLWSKKRDPRLKALVRNGGERVRGEPGRREMRMTEGAPASLPGELGVKLKEWTGIHWVVSLSREAGEPTLVEIDNNAREARLTDARADPDVAAILAQFPRARIAAARNPRGDERSEQDHLPAPAAAEPAPGDNL